jgi:tRNA-5-methyluridine54 2-sulfurtransferase
VFGFVDRAHDHFTDDAGAEREGLQACLVCGSPTTSDVCAFCRLWERVGSRADQSR